MSDRNQAAHELETWWLQQAHDEILRTVPKAIEYGAGDLVQIGRQLAAVSGRQVDDQQAAELGVYFYLIGKVARWTSAIEQDRLVSEDTLHDIGVYVRMAQRIRLTGSWPGIEPGMVRIAVNPTCGFHVVRNDPNTDGVSWWCARPAGHENGRDVFGLNPAAHTSAWPPRSGTLIYVEGK